MFTKKDFNSTEEMYKSLLDSAIYLFDGCEAITNYSNASALLNDYLENINWVGFYLACQKNLILGPFQGHPACVNIPYGNGVVGTCALQKELINVSDVHEFKGHIACDEASKSELVIPLIKNNCLIGILDIDSPVIGRFKKIDEDNLYTFVNILLQYV